MKSSLPTLSLSPLFLQHRDNQCIQLSHILLPDTLSAHIRKHLCKYYTGEKKDQNAMQEKRLRSIFPSFPGQEPRSSNILQCSVQEGPKEPTSSLQT